MAVTTFSASSLLLRLITQPNAIKWRQITEKEERERKKERKKKRKKRKKRVFALFLGNLINEILFAVFLFKWRITSP